MLWFLGEPAAPQLHPCAGTAVAEWVLFFGTCSGPSPSSRNLRVNSQNSRRLPGTCLSSLLIGQCQVLWVTVLNINPRPSDKLWINSPFWLKLIESISVFATQSPDWYLHLYTFNFMQAVFKGRKFISRYGNMSYRSVPAVRELCESTLSWHENIKKWNELGKKLTWL